MRRFRIDGGKYGGEIVLGTVSAEFVEYWQGRDPEELVEYIQTEGESDPDSPELDGYIWDCDDYEHVSTVYADGELFVTEVPADGSDDWDYGEVLTRSNMFESHYSREAYHYEEPVNDSDDPIVAYHSSEKGDHVSWFLDAEDFDPELITLGVVETEFGEFIEALYYDGIELDMNLDNAGTHTNYVVAGVGYMNREDHESQEDALEWLEDE
jgi:hypothetical protein